MWPYRYSNDLYRNYFRSHVDELSKKHYIYTTGIYSSCYSLDENIKIDLFRYFIGLLLMAIIYAVGLYKLSVLLEKSGIGKVILGR